MEPIKINELNNLIPISMFECCLIDGIKKKDMARPPLGKRKSFYYLEVFIHHLTQKHNLSIQEYVEKFLNIQWPSCPITNKKMGFTVSGKGLKISRYTRGTINKNNCEAFKKSCDLMSIKRRGKGNPMYGKKPWNKGDLEWGAYVRKINLGKKTSKESRLKQSESAKKRKIHGHAGKKHSEESKQKMRQATIERWKRGDFEFKKTSIETKVQIFLNEIGVEFKFQEQIGFFVADFFLEKENLIIECNGSFFHCEPDTKYSEAKFDVQKRNIVRDEKKRCFYRQQGINLLELWESEINSGEFKKKIKCALKK